MLLLAIPDMDPQKLDVVLADFLLSLQSQPGLSVVNHEIILSEAEKTIDRQHRDVGPSFTRGSVQQLEPAAQGLPFHQPFLDTYTSNAVNSADRSVSSPDSTFFKPPQPLNDLSESDVNYNHQFPPDRLWSRAPDPVHVQTTNLNQQVSQQAFPRALPHFPSPYSHPMPTPLMCPYRQSDNPGGMAYDPGGTSSTNAIVSCPGPFTGPPPRMHQPSHAEQIIPQVFPSFDSIQGYYLVQTLATPTQDGVYPQPRPTGSWQFVERKGISQSQLYLPHQWPGV